MYDVSQYADMGVVIVDEPRTIEARLAVHSPGDISSSYMPLYRFPPPYECDSTWLVKRDSN
eukprot:6208372-Pleurochrysis_carterae.AAC.2